MPSIEATTNGSAELTGQLVNDMQLAFSEFVISDGARPYYNASDAFTAADNMLAQLTVMCEQLNVFWGMDDIIMANEISIVAASLNPPIIPNLRYKLGRLQFLTDAHALKIFLYYRYAETLKALVQPSTSNGSSNGKEHTGLSEKVAQCVLSQLNINVGNVNATDLVFVNRGIKQTLERSTVIDSPSDITVWNKFRLFVGLYLFVDSDVRYKKL